MSKERRQTTFNFAGMEPCRKKGDREFWSASRLAMPVAPTRFREPRRTARHPIGWCSRFCEA